MRSLFGLNNDFPGALAPGIFFTHFIPEKSPNNLKNRFFRLNADLYTVLQFGSTMRFARFAELHG